MPRNGDRLGLTGRVRLTGSRGQAEVAAFMGRARVFVQHSITPPSGDREGTPVSILEASGAGLPIVSTRHGGIPDIVQEGESGFLVKEGDVLGMAERMIRLAQDDSLATRLGRVGHRRAGKLTLDSQISKLWRVICRVDDGAH